MVPYPTQERLHELYDYDPETGALTRRSAVAGRPKGSVVGAINPRGYRNVHVDGMLYSAHRLIWVYQYGQVPRELDHINRDGLDNRLANLRECTRSENNMNRGASRANTSGTCGVIRLTKRKAWVVRIRAHGKVAYEKTFRNIEDAREAAIVARAYFHGKFLPSEPV